MSRKAKKVKVKVSTRKRTTKPAEVTRLGAALRALGGLGGSAVGGLIGMPNSGASVGTSLGAALSRWLGSGDYTIGSNTIVKKSMKASDSIPVMHQEGQSIVVRHKEYLGEVFGSETFRVNQSYELNPGNSSTFPWLSGVAAHFQEYKIRGLVFHYIPTSGSAVSSLNAALGSVMMQTSYRSNDSAPTSKVEILNEYCSNEAVPSESFAHPVECDPRENPFNVQYVRTGAVPTGDSKLLYDLGVTHIAVSGQQITDKALGDLWVTYEIELKKPILESNVTSRGKSYSAECTTGPLTASAYFTPPTATSGTLNCAVDGRTLTFPKGTYGRFMLTVRFISSSTGFTAFNGGGIAVTSNCIPISYVGTTQFARTSLTTGAGIMGSGFYIASVFIPVPTSQATVQFPALTFSGDTLGSTQIVVTPMDLP
jgi:hypothetical protein